MARQSRISETQNKPQLVVSTFNCEKWKSNIMRDLMEDLSEGHAKNIIIACQETWKYEIPRSFRKEFGKKYFFIHVPAMDPNIPHGRGRPHGGLCFIISKNIAFKIIYSNCRCTSILLTDFNILLNSVYLAFDDSRISSEENLENMMEALGHLDAAHDLAEETTDYITMGDLNFAPTDRSRRSDAVRSFFSRRNYTDHDLTYLSEDDFTHKSGRILDRIVFTGITSNFIENVSINKNFQHSDHFSVAAYLSLETPQRPPTSIQKPKINWSKATDKALASYNNLAQKTCLASLKHHKKGELTGVELYKQLVDNIQNAALICLPKFKPNKGPRRHNIPMWRERMAPLKDDVTYWTQVQFLNGGPQRCPHHIRQQLRLAKSRFRREFRILQREISINVAEATTVNNCFKRMLRNPKAPTPAIINGCSTPDQPEMWRKHFKNVFNGDDSLPYKGPLIDDIHNELSENDVINFNYLTLNDINCSIMQIDTNKSYVRHSHWKYLFTFNHAAKLCLLHVFNSWINNVFSGNDVYFDWDFFAANLNVIPKKGKTDLSSIKSWRPITIGSSENWILEKIMQSRLTPYLATKDCQFGYKRQHSTNHAIEIVRVIERSHDAHVCFLDASSAFDKLSWRRIKDQLVKRNVPCTLVKLTMIQLFSTKISVCNTVIFFPRAGVKQGGVLSGVLFSSCYDDLVEALESTSAGILIACSKNRFKLICVIIYADDVLLVAASPHGLKCLINQAFIFANRYCDISFNASKSNILRLGRSRKEAVSVCGIPTAESYTYLGFDIGRAANPQKVATAKLYKNTNVLFSQNAVLKKMFC